MENAVERIHACKAENKVIFVASFFIKVQIMGHPVEKTDKYRQKEEEERTDTSQPWEKDARVSFL